MKSVKKPSTVHNNKVVDLLTADRNIQTNEDMTIMAIKYLVRKLKYHPNMLDALKTAIKTKGSVPTACVTIPRNKNGLVHIARTDIYPHVLYFKIWRSLDIKRKDLLQNKCCQFGFKLNCDIVCVNPYHYDRIGKKNSVFVFFMGFYRFFFTDLPCVEDSFTTVNETANDEQCNSMDVDSDVCKLEPIQQGKFFLSY